VLHRTKARGANFKAGSAFCTLLLVNDMDPVLATINRIRRAFPKASHTGLALLWVNMVRNELLAGKSRAPLLLDMCLILSFEVAYRA
jgi:hypothetical protein